MGKILEAFLTDQLRVDAERKGGVPSINSFVTGEVNSKRNWLQN